MKTVKPVNKETYDRIGKAYAICSEYPDVFGGVTMRKFCGMFVDDIIDEGEDIIEARKKAYAGEMYRLLQVAFLAMADAKVDEPLRLEIDECLCHITGDPCPTDDEPVDDESNARKRDHADDMYWMLSNIRYELGHGGASDAEYISQVIREIGEVLADIDEKEETSDE